MNRPLKSEAAACKDRNCITTPIAVSLADTKHSKRWPRRAPRALFVMSRRLIFALFSSANHTGFELGMALTVTSMDCSSGRRVHLAQKRGPHFDLSRRTPTSVWRGRGLIPAAVCEAGRGEAAPQGLWRSAFLCFFQPAPLRPTSLFIQSR
jgi:hypothetical protein